MLSPALAPMSPPSAPAAAGTRCVPIGVDQPVDVIRKLEQPDSFCPSQLHSGCYPRDGEHTQGRPLRAPALPGRLASRMGRKIVLILAVVFVWLLLVGPGWLS
jgi:hypothetical protein